jgi:hypothetical protein
VYSKLCWALWGKVGGGSNKDETIIRLLPADITESDDHSHLGGVVINVPARGPKGRGFEPGQGDEFLRMIKIRSTHSFG